MGLPRRGDGDSTDVLVQDEMALVAGSGAVHDLGQVLFQIRPEVQGLADVRIHGRLARDPSLHGTAADQAAAHGRAEVFLERRHDHLVAPGLLVHDDDGLAVQLEEVVPLAKEVVQRIPEVVLGPDVDVHVDVGVHVIGPAQGESLEVRHTLDHIDQPDRGALAHNLGTHRGVRISFADLHLQGFGPETLPVHRPARIGLGAVPGARAEEPRPGSVPAREPGSAPVLSSCRARRIQRGREQRARILRIGYRSSP